MQNPMATGGKGEKKKENIASKTELNARKRSTIFGHVL